VTAGGTGAPSAGAALDNLGGVALSGAAFTGPIIAPSIQGLQYASQVQTGAGNNGISNLVKNSTICPGTGNGCFIVATPNYAYSEILQGMSLGEFAQDPVDFGWPAETLVQDQRNASNVLYSEDPYSNAAAIGSVAKSHLPASLGHNGVLNFFMTTAKYAGGNEYFEQGTPNMGPNFYPVTGTESVVAQTEGFTTGDIVPQNWFTYCNSPGDCNANITAVTASGGHVNGSEEGTHGGDTYIVEGTEPSGTVTSTNYPSSIMVNFTYTSSGITPGTYVSQGDSKLLIDTASAKEITGAKFSPGIAGGSTGSGSPSDSYPPQAVDTTASWPISTVVQLCNPTNNNGGTCAAGSQPTGVVPTASVTVIQPPSPITLNIVAPYAGTPANYCTASTVQSSSPYGACYMPASGVGCIADILSFESVSYTYNSTAQTVTITGMKFPKINGMQFGVGGLCGYAAKANVDNNQWFPIIGSPTATTFVYGQYSPMNNSTPATLGDSNSTAYANGGTNSGITSQLCVNDIVLSNFSLSGNTVTASYSSPSQVLAATWDIFNGLSMTITTTNSTYNGTWPVTVNATGNNVFQYTPTTTPSGTVPTAGTVTYCNMAYTIAPAVMTASVYNPATSKVDGYVGLEPNNSPFAVGDTVIQAPYPWVHFSEKGISAVSFTRHNLPISGAQGAMLAHEYVNAYGDTVPFAESFWNNTPLSSYLGFGGTNGMPGHALYVAGAWSSPLLFQYPPAPSGNSNGLNALITINGFWPSPVGSTNKLLSLFNVYQGPWAAWGGVNALSDEYGPFNKWSIPNITIGPDWESTELFQISSMGAGVLGLSKDNQTATPTPDGELLLGKIGFGLTGTPMSSTSSANSQIVTCPAGGTGAQYCSASGAWTTPTSTGSLPFTSITGTATTTQIGTGAAATGKYVDGGTGVWTTLPAAVPTLLIPCPQLSVPTGNTGNTTNNLQATCAIPAGAMGLNSQLHIDARYSSCTGVGVPFAACTAANIGTCTVRDDFTLYNTLGGINWMSIALPAHTNGTVSGTISNQNSLSSQVTDSVVNGAASATQTSSYSTSSPTYINFGMQNSVSTDICYLDSYSVTLLP
jgi:hypothetical protein